MPSNGRPLEEEEEDDDERTVELTVQNSQTEFFFLLLDFGNFKHYAEKFPATSYESILKSYGDHFDSLLLKTELSIIYLSEEFLQSNISDLLKYFIPSTVNTALSEFRIILPCY
jgi:hypothetical protein